MERMELDGSPMARIETQPMPFRFRWDGDKIGSGRAAGDTVPDLCEIRVDNYNGSFDVYVSILEKHSDTLSSNHLYSPVKNQWTQDGPEWKKSFCGSKVHKIPKLGVVRPRAKDSADASSKNSACVRFRFRIEWMKNWNLPRTVLISGPVSDTRGNSLALVNMNPDEGGWNSSKEITLLCIGATSKTKVYFKTEDRGPNQWKKGATVTLRHKQSALVVLVPVADRFRTTNGKVHVILEDGNDFSNSLLFTYKAEPQILPTRAKRQREDNETSSNASKRLCTDSLRSGLQCDGAVDEMVSHVALKDILFDLAAGDINFDEKLSDRLMESQEVNECEDDDGYNALATAILMGNFEVARHFLAELPSRSSRRHALTSQSFSDLHLSHLHLLAFCSADRVPLSLFRAALSAGLSPGDCDADGNSLLHLLIRRGRIDEVVEVLSDEELCARFRPHLNVANSEGLAPLHAAILGRQPRGVKALLAAGADPNLASRKSRLTPLHMAVLCAESQQMIQQLVEAKAELNACSLEGKTALDMAAEQGHTELESFLKSHHAEYRFNAEEEEEEEEEEGEEEEEEEEEEEGRGSEVEEREESKEEEEEKVEVVDRDSVEQKLNALSNEELKELLNFLPGKNSVLRKSSSLTPEQILRFLKPEAIDGALKQMKKW